MRTRCKNGEKDLSVINSNQHVLSTKNLDETTSHHTIDVDLAGILGGRMARAEGGLVPSGVGYAEGCPFFSRGVWGSVVSSPSGVCFLKATERSFLYTYMTKSAGDKICIIAPYSKFWGGTCPPVPRDLRPCITRTDSRKHALINSFAVSK